MEKFHGSLEKVYELDCIEDGGTEEECKAKASQMRCVLDGGTEEECTANE